jgi:ABC-type nitrate/sulfonate/bicarbonate transport system permease component
MFASMFTPFWQGPRFSVKFIALAQALILMALWVILPASTGIPSPLDIAHSWDTLARNNGLIIELLTSVATITKALLLSTILSFSIAYLTTATIFKPIGGFMSSMRFLGFAGLTFLFTLWTSSGEGLKLALLTFGMTVFLSCSCIAEVKSVTASQIDYARSLGLSGWGITYEMIVGGKMNTMFDLVRQNAAVGWTLLSMVEGLVRSEGGIGALLLTQNKYFNLSAVFAIQLTILSYGILQDYALNWLRRACCKHATLNDVK